jgi:Microtubule binding
LNIRLHSEIAHRKKLHNELEDLKGKIRVFCRVRPLTKLEEERNAKSIVRKMDDFTIKFKSIMTNGQSELSSQ